MNAPEYPISGERRHSNTLTHVFVALASVAGALAIGSVVATVILLRHNGVTLGGTELATMGVALILGLCGVVLCLLAINSRRQMTRLIEQMAALEQRTAIIAEQSVARTREQPPTAAPTVDPQELRAALREIRDVLLLPQDQRVRRYQAVLEAEVQRRIAASDRFVASRDFHRARQELTALTDRFEMDDRIREAQNRLENAADEARAQDLTQAATRIQDLMGLARWHEAEHLARELADKYPAAAEPPTMLERIAHERKLFEQRHRQRLIEEIQQCVRERHWKEAADGTRRFLEMFPTDIEATPLREQLQTLEANAEIQTRQLLELEFKELLQQHRYWDAVGLARRIVAEFPMSPQANALRGQMARLEELARGKEPRR